MSTEQNRRWNLDPDDEYPTRDELPVTDDDPHWDRPPAASDFDPYASGDDDNLMSGMEDMDDLETHRPRRGGSVNPEEDPYGQDEPDDELDTRL